MSIIKNKGAKNKSLKIVALVAILLFITAGIYKYKLVHAYYENMRYNHFSVGDPIRAAPHFLNMPASTQYTLRLLKNVDGDYYCLNSDIEITSDSLQKYKSNYIGIYTGYKIVPFHIHDKTTGKDTSGVFTFLKFTPNQKGIKKVTPQRKPDEARGYEFVDKEYYIFFWSTSVTYGSR